ncbi:hypothetical protein EYF80_018473 [Liparis tanakae]|uniref:Uncharacterized protein n=1 Tax=Liparis tanakae TaxID=230148 RepID=A0A4Z2I0D5_9TELE|nr:hypothetical protein EYF80_018473 [Liparis tanakae]
MAGQSPHIVYRQAGRPVGLQCQRGEPVQGHKREEAGVIDWVLVPGIEEKMDELPAAPGVDIRAAGVPVHTAADPFYGKAL